MSLDNKVSPLDILRRYQGALDNHLCHKCCHECRYVMSVWKVRLVLWIFLEDIKVHQINTGGLSLLPSPCPLSDLTLYRLQSQIYSRYPCQDFTMVFSFPPPYTAKPGTV